MNLEREKEHFKNHVATLTDYGNIKILDFKRTDSNEYRVRFLFEEDYCRLHISGDLGELTATNYKNMTYEKFSDFVKDIGYFEQKIDCHSRDIYFYSEDKAKEQLKEYLEEYGVLDDVLYDERYDFETDEDKLDDFFYDVLEDFTIENGIGSKGYDAVSKYIDDFWEISSDIGRKNTGILDMYMLAFKLATEQLKGVK